VGESGRSSQGPSAQGTSSALTAVALDGRFDPATSAERLGWSELRRTSYARVVETPGGGTAYLFGFGAVVLDHDSWLDPEVRARIDQATDARLLPQTAETFRVRIDPTRSESAPRVGWDQVALREGSPELVATMALALAQSAALERYERRAEGLLEEALELSRSVAGGKLPRSSKELVRRVGRLTGDRLELARWFYLVDRPEETWDDARVAATYDALFDNFELRERHDAMLQKLSAVESATQTVINVWHGRRSNALEWAIVLLIVVDIVLVLGEKIL
jgi:uncharacterized Rmd1/YagE family protein